MNRLKSSKRVNRDIVEDGIIRGTRVQMYVCQILGGSSERRKFPLQGVVGPPSLSKKYWCSMKTTEGWTEYIDLRFPTEVVLEQLEVYVPKTFYTGIHLSSVYSISTTGKEMNVIFDSSRSYRVMYDMKRERFMIPFFREKEERVIQNLRIVFSDSKECDYNGLEFNCCVSSILVIGRTTENIISKHSLNRKYIPSHQKRHQEFLKVYGLQQPLPKVSDQESLIRRKRTKKRHHHHHHRLHRFSSSRVLTNKQKKGNDDEDDENPKSFPHIMDQNNNHSIKPQLKQKHQLKMKKRRRLKRRKSDLVMIDDRVKDLVSKIDSRHNNNNNNIISTKTQKDDSDDDEKEEERKNQLRKRRRKNRAYSMSNPKKSILMKLPSSSNHRMNSSRRRKNSGNRPSIVPMLNIPHKINKYSLHHEEEEEVEQKEQNEEEEEEEDDVILHHNEKNDEVQVLRERVRYLEKKMREMEKRMKEMEEIVLRK